MEMEKKKELVFHGTAFIMDVQGVAVEGGGGQCLVVTAEEKETGDRWQGQVGDEERAGGGVLLLR